MLTCQLQFKKKQCPFVIEKVFLKKEDLPKLFTVNQILVEFAQLLKSFFLPSGCKFGAVYTFPRRCFRIYSV